MVINDYYECWFYSVSSVSTWHEREIGKLEARVKLLEADLVEAQSDLDIADEIHYDEIQDANRFNNLLIFLIIALVLRVVTSV